MTSGRDGPPGPPRDQTDGPAVRPYLSIVVVCLLVLFALVAHAAEPPVAPKPPVVFTAFAWDVLNPDGDLVLNFKVKGKPQSVGIAWRDRSLPLVCEGPGPLVFTRTGERDGKPVEIPVASADIPEEMTRALLVFGLNPSREPGAPLYRVKVIDDSYTVFPGQSVRFLNYSSMELGGSLGTQAFVVMPGGDQVVPATLPETNRLLPFRLARRDAAGGWKKLRSTGLPMSEGLRVLVFLLDDPQKPGRTELVLLRDRVETPPPIPPGVLAGGKRITRKP